jgi:hypothetical protein
VHSRPPLCRISDIRPLHAGPRVVHTAAPLMPSVWTEAGHQAVLWCNQITSALASFLLEAVSAPTGAPHT